MTEYIYSVGTIIVLLILAIIVLIPKKKEPKIMITACKLTKQVNVFFEGFNEEQKQQLLELFRFEVMGIQNKLEEYVEGKEKEEDRSQTKIDFGESS